MHNPVRANGSMHASQQYFDLCSAKRSVNGIEQSTACSGRAERKASGAMQEEGKRRREEQRKQEAAAATEQAAQRAKQEEQARQAASQAQLAKEAKSGASALRIAPSAAEEEKKAQAAVQAAEVGTPHCRNALTESNHSSMSVWQLVVPFHQCQYAISCFT